jgi:hypothetical protein
MSRLDSWWVDMAAAVSLPSWFECAPSVSLLNKPAGTVCCHTFKVCCALCSPTPCDLRCLLLVGYGMA